MVLDYSERKQVSKNRPRKQPVGIFIFLIAGAVVTAFGLGVLAGWLMFKPARQSIADTSPRSVKGAPTDPVPLQRPAGYAVRTQEPPLTFYETLSKGNKAVIGSGLNPKRPGDPGTVIPAAPPSPDVKQPQPQKTVKPAVLPPPDRQEKSVEESGDTGKAAMNKPEKESPGKKPEQDNGNFSVQIASYRERKEAEEVKARVAARGLAAYIVESNLPGKGLWYRVRVGRRLDQESATELAKKAGKGALVVPE